MTDLTFPISDEDANEFLDRVELGLVSIGGGKDNLPVLHEFAGDIYTRQIFIPAGTMLTSKVHNTTHPFFILYGQISVWTAEGGVKTYTAPDRGVTVPGTRRLLYAWSDTVWVTCHSWVDKPHDPELVEMEILQPYGNLLLEGVVD